MHWQQQSRMEASDAARQVDELINLQEQWFAKDGGLQIKTPALFSRLQKSVGSSSNGTLSVRKKLLFEIDCRILHPESLSDLTLQIEFPFNYPSSSTCKVLAIKSSNGDEYQECSSAISKYLDTFCGCECIEMLLDWIDENKSTCLLERNTHSSIIPEDMVPCYVLRYNHLLSGPEHKKEKAMISVAKKANLQGGLLWGTPGIVVIVPPSSEEDAKDYASECRVIGKRAEGPNLVWMPMTGIDEAGMGGLAQQKRGDRLQELDTAGLRCACGGNEDLLKEILGVN